MNIICIDAGTSNIKSQIFSTNGPESPITLSPVNGCFDLENGILNHEEFIKITRKNFLETLKNSREERIDAVGLITVGPTLAILESQGKIREVRNYNYQKAQDGVKKIIQMDLYKIRGVGAGAQFTPEQIIQLKKNKEFKEGFSFTSIASLLCNSLGGSLAKWSFPEASYNGLIDVKKHDYFDALFKELKFERKWFPKLTSKEAGYLKNSKIPIFNLGTDGPATQAYLGENYYTFKVESTCAIRVSGKNPIFNEKPLIKGFPGVWNVLFKEPDGEDFFVSGATTNAGVNTIKHYFPDISDEELKNLDNELIKMLAKKIPDLKELGVELPFEFGERDGIPRASGIMGRKPKGKIHLYYAIKEGVLFNLMQRVSLVRKAQIAAKNKLTNKFLITGAITISKPWIDLAVIMLSDIAKVRNPKLVNPTYQELGLAAVAKGVFRKMNFKNKIDTKGETFDMSTLSVRLNGNKTLLRRWEAYKKYYDASGKTS